MTTSRRSEISLSYVPSILAQMDGYAVRAGLFTDDRRVDNARLDCFAGFPDGGDVIDIDV